MRQTIKLFIASLPIFAAQPQSDRKNWPFTTKTEDGKVPKTTEDVSPVR